jgi:ribosomal protein S18 acetylase RimI-like enzyme
MMTPKIRLAQDSDAEDIKRILENCNLIPNGLNFSRVYPSWLVAEYKGEIVGCCQVLIGFPLGHIGFWAIDPSRQGYGFGIFLWKAAEIMLANHGCDGFTGLTDHKDILKRLESVGAVIFGPPVNWIFKRVKKIGVAIENIQETRH